MRNLLFNIDLKKRSVLFFLLLCFGLSSCHKHELKFEPFHVIDSETQSSFGGIVKHQYYLLSNYKNDFECNRLLDSFVNEHKVDSISRFQHYSITFYNKSKKTNNEYLVENPRSLDRYSNEHDLLLAYKWSSNGSFFSKYFYEDGGIVTDDDDMKIEFYDPKDSLHYQD